MAKVQFLISLLWIVLTPGCGWLQVDIISSHQTSISGNVSLVPAPSAPDSSDPTSNLPALKLSPDLSEQGPVTGETIQFSGAGGLPPYTFYIDSGSGKIDPLTGVYQAPLVSQTGTEVIRIIDSLGNFFLSQFQLRGFSVRQSLVGEYEPSRSLGPIDIIEKGGVLFSYSNTGPLGKPYQNVKILKSTDNGLNWVVISTISLLEHSLNTRVKSMEVIDAKVQVQGLIEKPTSTQKTFFWFIAESSDDCLTWTTTQLIPLGEVEIITSLLTTDGHILLGGLKPGPNLSSDSILYRCDLQTLNCQTISTYHSDYSHDAYFNIIKRANNGRIYAAQRQGWDSYISESLDEGITWTTINSSTAYSNLKIIDLKISSDSQRIVFGGSVSLTPDIVAELNYNEATSAWVETRRDAGICNGWYVNSVIMNDNNDSLVNCWDLGTFTGGVEKSYIYRRVNGQGSWTKQLQLNGSGAGKLSSTPTGRVYFANSGGYRKYSDNFGTSWNDANIQTFKVPTSAQLYSAVASADLEKAIYTVGSTTLNTTTDLVGVVYKSLDQGKTWSVLRSDLAASGTSIEARSLAENSETSTLIVGSAIGTQDYNQNFNEASWKIEKYSPSLNQWNTLETFTPVGASVLKFKKVLRGNSQTLFAMGHFADTSTGSTHAWAVRQSLDGGANWSTISRYQLVSGRAAEVNDALFHAGNLYVVGKAKDSSIKDHWIVQRYDGTQWHTDDDVLLDEVTNGSAKGAASIAASLDGTLYVAGSYLDSSNRSHWVVRKKSPSETTWSTMDDFVSDSGLGAEAEQILLNPQGVIFVAGRSKTKNNLWFGTIRFYKNEAWHMVHRDEKHIEGSYTGLLNCHDGKICALGRYLGTEFQSIGFMQILE